MNKIFDYNFHLVIKNSKNVNDTIFEDQNLNEKKLLDGINYYNRYLKRLNGFNLLLFNTSIYDQELLNFKNKLLEFEKTFITVLLDFRRPDVFEYIDCLKQNNVDSVMVNSYLQKIENKDFPKVLEVLNIVNQKKLKFLLMEVMEHLK